MSERLVDTSGSMQCFFKKLFPQILPVLVFPYLPMISLYNAIQMYYRCKLQHGCSNDVKELVYQPLESTQTTETAKRFPCFRGPYCFNEFPRDIRSLESFVPFKSKLREHFYRKRNCKEEKNLKA